MSGRDPDCTRAALRPDNTAEGGGGGGTAAAAAAAAAAATASAGIALSPGKAWSAESALKNLKI